MSDECLEVCCSVPCGIASAICVFICVDVCQEVCYERIKNKGRAGDTSATASGKGTVDKSEAGTPDTEEKEAPSIVTTQEEMER
mmetsp:Transcript_9662/g.17572  ORF Transcript_9662/g.17572 Transcript_9662/m.17572 type:complete len:84 (-) Transcript_9662:1898-2149(-)